MLLSCRYVDEVRQNMGDADSKPAILAAKPDIIVIGSDWARKDYYTQMGFTQDWLDENRISLCYIPRHLENSSTNVKQKARDDK